jgi:two-component system, OmpR family, sensor kinase
VSAKSLLAPETILGRTILLLLGIAVLLTAVNVSIILSRPPPREAPLNTFEIARLLKGLPIAKSNSNVTIARLPGPPTFQANTRVDQLTLLALARDLGAPIQNVRFKHVGKLPQHLSFLEPEMERSLRVYGPDKFEALVPHGFRAAVKLPDGQWEVVWRKNVDELADWRNGIIIRFVISLALMLPIAWWFARRLTEPIHAFGSAAERLGRERRVEPVDVKGPAEIRQAAEALNEMQRRIRGYVLERTSVVGAIAHDLRTPLSRLKFHLASAPEPLRAKAEAEIDEMEQMIAASLEFADAEARPHIRERLDLALLVEGVVDDLSDLGRDVTLERRDTATVHGDHLLLKRLFTNLINNAVTYGRRALVTIHSLDGSAVVDIDDEGPGLDKTSLDRAFEPFYRAEGSRNRATGGMGLGLAIVKAAALSHGGDVELINRSEGGLRARVMLPLESA